MIEEAASSGNQFALQAVTSALRIRELQGMAVKSIGTIAGNGNADALEMLLNHEKYGFLLSSTVAALQPAAENGNQKAIDALAAVLTEEKNRGLWPLALGGLEKAAQSGNVSAVDAFVAAAANTNAYVRQVVVRGLSGAAANQNAKATETLRAMGIQWAK